MSTRGHCRLEGDPRRSLPRRQPIEFGSGVSLVGERRRAWLMRTDSMPKTVDRVLVLGLDGATWSVLDPMRQRGLMPNLDAFLSRSAAGTLRSTIPPVTTAA